MTLLFLITVSILVYYFFIYKQPGSRNFFSEAAHKKCPNCGNPVDSNFNVCPICKETLKKRCLNCGKTVDITWKYCPYCESNLRDKS